MAESSEDLIEDLEEEGQPVEECPPYLQRPGRVHVGLSQLGHGHSETVSLSLSENARTIGMRRILKLSPAFGYVRSLIASVASSL